MTTINTYIKDGNDIIPTTVTCTLENGIGIHVNGLDDSNAKKTLLRIAKAMNAFGHPLPGKKITLDIHPEVKHGTTGLLNVPTAIAILSETSGTSIYADAYCIGELRPDGTAFCPDKKTAKEIAKYHRQHTGTPLLFIPKDGGVTDGKSVLTFGALKDCTGPLNDPNRRTTFHILCNDTNAVTAYMEMRDKPKRNLRSLRKYADTAMVLTVNLYNPKDIHEVLNTLGEAGVDNALIDERDAEALTDILNV